jgi:hypothetical protein
MSRTRTALAVSALALAGATVLAGCSSASTSSETSAAASPAASAAASPASTTQMLPPVIITADQTEATCKVGDNLDIVIDEKDLAGTTVDTDKPELVELTQAHEDGGATFNPGGKCLAAGTATITVTNPNSSTRDIALTITQ